MSHIQTVYASTVAALDSTYATDEALNAAVTTLNERIDGLSDEIEDIGTTDTEQRKILQSVIIAVVHIIYLTSQFDAYTLEHESPALLNAGEAEIK